jgi:hypothetical protein
VQRRVRTSAESSRSATREWGLQPLKLPHNRLCTTDFRLVLSPQVVQTCTNQGF